MTIVHLTFSLETGGIQTMLVDILNEQCADHRVALVIVNDYYDSALLAHVDARVAVYRLGRRPGSYNLLPVLKLNALLWRLRPEAVHCHNHELAALLLPGRYRTGLTIHDVRETTRYLHRYHRLFAISQAVAADVRRRSGHEPVVIYNGIRTDQLTVREWRSVTAGNNVVDAPGGATDVATTDEDPATTFRTPAKTPPLRSGRPANPHRRTGRPAFRRPANRRPAFRRPAFRMVQISRLHHEKKGQHLLLAALHELVHGRGLTHLHLDFIGEGDSLAYLNAQTDALGLRAHVRFLGLRSRHYVYTHLRDYDLLVQPSLYEGFGLTVAEAMAAGVPVLVSAIEGPIELIDGGRCGWSFPVGDVAACADQIAQLADNRNLANVVQKTTLARHYVRQHFDVRQTARRYAAAYALAT